MAAVAATPRAPGPRQLAFAERDLEWWFCAREASLGVGAQRYEQAIQGGDFNLSGRAIVGMFEWRTRKSVEKSFPIQERIKSLGSKFQTSAELLYCPNSRIPLFARDWFTVPRTLEEGERTTTGIVTCAALAMLTPSFERKWRTAGEATPLEFLEAVFLLPSSTRPRWTHEARAEAFRLRIALLTQYALTWTS